MGSIIREPQVHSHEVHLETGRIHASLTEGFADRTLTCVDCGAEFTFSAGEQAFFREKQFSNTPKRCKRCRAKRDKCQKPGIEVSTKCAECGIETTVPFKPTQGGPVLCRLCFRNGTHPRAA